MSAASLDALLTRLARALKPTAASEPRVIDVGCGKGEMLVRTIERIGGRGLGLEPNPSFAADARRRIARRLSPERVVVIGAEFEKTPLPQGTFTVGVCTGALHAFGDWREALAGMRRLVAAGGYALLGPGYWKQPPAPEYLAAFGGEEGEQESLPLTLKAAEDAQWQVLECHASTESEWDEYEHSYAAQMRAWCDAHADDLDASEFRERIERWNAAYHRWGRTTMGYALLLLRRGD